MGRNIQPHQKFGQTSPAVVAEWLRRLTRNQFPSGSAGSNPADCEIFWSKNLHRPGIEPGPPAWQASILPLNQRCYTWKLIETPNTSKFWKCQSLCLNKKLSQLVGFEPTLPEGNWFLVSRLNHSATTAILYFKANIPCHKTNGHHCFSWDL